MLRSRPSGGEREDDLIVPYKFDDVSQLQTYPADGEGQWPMFEILDTSGGRTGAVEVAVFAAGE